jgi:colanic acid/amylovoran biosynthesis glycosyltransferase
MKIAFVVGEFPALSITFIIRQIAAMIERGHDVDIYPSRPGPPGKQHEMVGRFDMMHRAKFPPAMPGGYVARMASAARLVAQSPRRDVARRLSLVNPFAHGADGASLRLLHELAPFRDRIEYDVIHCHFAVNAIRAAAGRDAGLLRGPMLTTFLGYDVTSYPKRRGAGVYRRVFASGERFTAISSFMAEKAVALGCPRDRIVLLPLGIDAAQFPFRERSPGRKGEIRLITVGRLVQKKGIEYSIRAAAAVGRVHPQLLYRIVGDGPLRASLQALIDELGVGDRVQLVGAMTQEELRGLYDDSHLFVLSSVTADDGDTEGQGLVLQEAQAMGLPVLSTLHNGIPEGVRDGATAFLVPERDVDALAERLRQLVENPQLWPAMGRAGRALVEERFDVRKLDDRLEEVYRSMAKS